jgi:hypothetical protein
MSRFTKLLITGILALAVIAPVASAGPRVFVVGGGFYGPAFYGPGWYGPYGYAYAPNAGSVKIDTKLKDTAVYVDGGYAGTVGQLKTFHLRTGEHNIELRNPDGHSFYQEKVTVVGGKTLTIHP